MSRFTFALLTCMIATSVAVADALPIPRLVKIPVLNVIKYANEFPNHAFYAILTGPDGPSLVKMTADVKKPHNLIIPDGCLAQLYAVQKDQVKNYKTPKDFIDAVNGVKLPPGVTMSGLIEKQTEVLPSDPRQAVKRVINVAGDGKSGVKFTVEEESPKGRDPEPETPTADERPAPRLMLAGLAATLAVAFGGLWAFRRGK